jgi:hypothetical protein
MRAIVRLVACAAAVGALGACSAVDLEYYRTGVGTNLYTADMPAATELQNAYLNYLCRQSSPVVAPGGDDQCGTVIPPGTWPLMVQAGMNDIDQRCNAYLAWLDEKRRTNTAIVEELGIIRGAADLVINSQFGASPRSLAALAAAFTLATGTFGKLSSFLLLAEQSTVVAVVRGRQKELREQVRASSINNRPMAVHALQSYLLICMPMTIAADINSTVTVFQQGGSGALDHKSFVNSPTLGRPLTARTSLPPTTPLTGDERPRNCVTRQECSMAIGTVIQIQSFLCVSQDGAFGPMTRDGIRIFNQAGTSGATASNQIDSRSASRLLTGVKTRGECPAQFISYYERTLFEGATPGETLARITAFQEALNQVAGSGDSIKTFGSFDNATRMKIENVRKTLNLPPNGSPRAVNEALRLALLPKPPPLQ